MYDTIALLIIGGILVFLLAFAMGANDIANALGPPVGSGALSMKQGLIGAAIFEFIGAISLGHLVSPTLKTGIISPEDFGHSELFVLGIMCALSTSVLWVFVATFAAMPVSTTHTLVGGIIGFVAIEHGLSAVKTSTIISVILSWVISPLFGGILGYLIYFPITRFVFSHPNPYEMSLRILPLFHASTVMVAAGIIAVVRISTSGNAIPHATHSFQTLSKIFLFPFFYTTPVLAVLWVLAAALSRYLIVPQIRSQNELTKKKDPPMTLHSYDDHDIELSEFEPERDVMDMISAQSSSAEEGEENFRYLMIISSIFVAFSHGANDITHILGPFSVVVDWAHSGVIREENELTPTLLVIFGGFGICVGALLAQRVVETVGKQIVKLTYSRGFSAQLAASLTLIIATLFNLPTSTTTIIVGSITGVGLVQEKGKLAAQIDKTLLTKIVMAWLLTFTLGLSTSAVLYYLLKLMIY